MKTLKRMLAVMLAVVMMMGLGVKLEPEVRMIGFE